MSVKVDWAWFPNGFFCLQFCNMGHLFLINFDVCTNMTHPLWAYWVLPKYNTSRHCSTRNPQPTTLSLSWIISLECCERWGWIVQPPSSIATLIWNGLNTWKCKIIGGFNGFDLPIINNHPTPSPKGVVATIVNFKVIGPNIYSILYQLKFKWH